MPTNLLAPPKARQPRNLLAPPVSRAFANFKPQGTGPGFDLPEHSGLTADAPVVGGPGKIPAPVRSPVANATTAVMQGLRGAAQNFEARNPAARGPILGAPAGAVAGFTRGVAGMLESAGGIANMAGAQQLGSTLAATGAVAKAQVPRSENAWYSPTGLAERVGEVAPQMMGAVGAAMATGGSSVPATIGAFAATSAGPMVGQQYLAALDKHGDRNLAAYEAATAGLITLGTSVLPGMAILQQLPGGQQLIQRSASALVGRIGTAMGAEGLQEMSEQVLTDSAVALMRDDPETFNRIFQGNPEYWGSVLEAGAIGSLAGGAARGGVEIASSATSTEPQRAADSPAQFQGTGSTDVVPSTPPPYLNQAQGQSVQVAPPGWLKQANRAAENTSNPALENPSGVQSRPETRPRLETPIAREGQSPEQGSSVSPHPQASQASIQSDPTKSARFDASSLSQSSNPLQAKQRAGAAAKVIPLLNEGWKPVTFEAEDSAERTRLEKQVKSLAGTYPMGNANHPDTIKYRELKARLAQPFTKTEYRMESPDGILRPIAKTDYEVAVELGQSATQSLPQPQGEGKQAFTTAMGSRYTYDPSTGKSIRDKAARADHPGEQGIQPESEATVFVSLDDSDEVLHFTNLDPAKKPTSSYDGDSLVLEYDQGKGRMRKVIPFKRAPELGMAPVEMWKHGTHVGNEITSIDSPKPPAPPSPAIRPAKAPLSGGTAERAVEVPLEKVAGPEGFSSLPYKDLKARAKSLNLDSKGTKAQLVARLQAATDASREQQSSVAAAANDDVSAGSGTDVSTTFAGKAPSVSSPDNTITQEGGKAAKETIADRVKGSSAKVATLIDTRTGERLSLSFSRHSSGMGTFAVVASNGKNRQSFRMEYAAGKPVVEALADFEEYLNIDNKPGTFKVEIDPPKAATPPKPKADSDVVKLKELRKVRFKTASDERMIEILQARIKADPAKWKVGDGVGWRVYAGGKSAQINRGFRIVEIDTESKQALVRQVADTGLTTSGGDNDAISDNWVHIADLVRDKKYSGVSKLVNPGEKASAMGSMANPNMERDDQGRIIFRPKSAADLVGTPQSEPTPTKSRYSSPNTEFEKRYQQAKGVGKLPLGMRLRGFWNKLAEVTQRGALPKLPRTTEFGEARSASQRYRNAPAFSAYQTEDLFARTIKPLSRDDYDLFTRKVLFDDLTSTEGALPFGLDIDAAKAEAARVNELIEGDESKGVIGNQRVKASVEYRQRWMDAVKSDYIDAHKSLGVDLSKRFKRENYFRHQVLYYMRLKQAERAGISAMPNAAGRAQTKLNRGFLKKREGSVLDINTDYLQAEWEVVSQMVADTERANALGRIKERYDIRDTLDDPDQIPEGYAEYQFRPGRAMFMANTIPESVASRLFEEAGTELGITADDISRVMAMGSEYKPVVVPEPVAKQLEELSKVKEHSILDRLVTVPMTWWKRWILQSPKRVITYNLRNMTEVDKVIGLNPSSLTKVPTAIKHLSSLYSGSEETPAEVREWVKRGGANTLVRVNELGEVNELSRFARLIDDRQKGVVGKVASVPGKAWRGYWNTVGIATDFRESILRYASYLDYLSQIEASTEGKPGNYGGSTRAEVDGITDPRDKAMRLSADLMGDYSDVSILGQFLRQRVFPFWSFKETNFRTYLNGIKNLASNEQTAVRAGLKIGKALGVKGLVHAPFMAYKLGRISILLYGFGAALTALNRVMFPDDDDELNPKVKRTAHLTMGRNADGEVVYFSRLGTAADFLEWFGADSLYYDFMDVQEGRRTLKDIAVDYAKSPVNVASQGITPFIKVPAELAAGKTAFPDVFEPRTIRDRGQHLAQALGLEAEYKAAFGKPTRGYGRNLISGPFSKTDPGQAAYGRIQDLKREFMQESLGQGMGSSEGPRSDALYNYKQAIRFKDEVAAERYLSLYMSFGGTKSGLKQSLERMEPLGGLSAKNKKAFKATLRQEDAELLVKAEAFYDEVLLGKKP
jgi:hypothetical protein